ncbi:PrsW family intramembrane metalloprotease [Agromyces aerolatus]|uniref:PrsW family intramembrane metalloprotease n=1 Tax=Agromyces sp. LY-1074 TaxID=3074080 RepID=UPI002856A78E|nr:MULTISPECIES: PrsW family intramembrane metalloprotease [unclassified Agromyces]MDR5701078.1 PrsW family intramembrane metalloprotease [Agromyces sp. LY-1074]MDR5707718.1 PrsW family intramembrane metalloprotease [Agromyces sp. LY-1358]
MSVVSGEPAPGRVASPRSGAGAVVFAVLGIALGGLAALLVIAYLALALGLSTLVVGSLLAFIPLIAVLLAIRWVDRWEPEPRWALWFAFLWGAAVSVAIALIVDLGVQLAVAAVTPGGAPDEALQAVVQAPVVEEVAKGLGVLLLFAFARAHFDGPVDGLVYAATVAGGFAFTENVLYFGAALVEGGAAGLGTTFVVRGIFSPFAHVLFTACIGLALGVAARRGASAGAGGWFLLGLGGAIALHALWNGSLAFSGDAIGLYVTVQVPIFVAAIVLAVWLRRQEVRITRAALAEYAAAGWFHASEIDLLATTRGRRDALRWARGMRPPRAAEMRRLITDATHLAFDRHAVATGRRRRSDEAALLARIAADRAALSAR